MAQVVLNVGDLAGAEVINDKDLVTVRQQPVYQMGTNVACSTGDQYLHVLLSSLVLHSNSR
jgi:hypothetical protein